MEAMGVKVLVNARQNWDEQGKRQVNDKFDARVMCRRLSDFLDGHKHALSIVRVPSREEEQRRRFQALEVCRDDGMRREQPIVVWMAQHHGDVEGFSYFGHLTSGR